MKKLGKERISSVKVVPIQDMTDHELMTACREYHCGIYENTNPKTDASKGTSLWAALHANSIILTTILRAIQEVDVDAAQHSLDRLRKLALNDPEPPITMKERAAMDRGAMTPGPKVKKWKAKPQSKRKK